MFLVGCYITEDVIPTALVGRDEESIETKFIFKLQYCKVVMKRFTLICFMFLGALTVHAQIVGIESSYYGKNFQICNGNEKINCIDSTSIIRTNFGEIKSHKEGWLTTRGSIINTVSAYVIRSQTDSQTSTAIVFLEDFNLEQGNRVTCHACAPTQVILIYETDKSNRWILNSSNKSDPGVGGWGYLSAQYDINKPLIYSDNKDNILFMIPSSGVGQGIIEGGYAIYYRNKNSSNKSKRIKSMGWINTYLSLCGGMDEAASGYDSQLVVRYSKKQFYPEIKLFKTNYNQCNTASDFETQQEETYVFDDKTQSYKQAIRRKLN